jgi:hypothetical protein
VLGTPSSRFAYPLIFFNNASSNIKFTGNIYTSANITIRKTSTGTGKIILASSLQTVDLGTANWENDNTGQPDVKVDMQIQTNTDFIAGNITFGTIVPYSPAVNLTVTNSQQLSLYGDITLSGTFTQNGAGNTMICKATISSNPLTIKASNGITFEKDIVPYSAAKGKHLSLNAQNNGSVLIKGFLGSSTLFDDIEILANTSADTSELKNNLAVANFSFEGFNLTTKAITANNFILIDNVGRWEVTGNLNGGSILEGVNATPPGTSVVNGDIYANTNITFEGALELKAPSLALINRSISNSSTGGTISLASVAKTTGYNINVNIVSNQNIGPGDVTITGNMGGSNTSDYLGIVEIQHGGTLKLGTTAPINIYASRLYQSSAGKPVEINAEKIYTNGTDGAGGIVFAGNIKLKNTTSVIEFFSNQAGGSAPITFNGTVVGNSNIRLQSDLKPITFYDRIGGTGPDADRIGRLANTCSLDISDSGLIVFNGLRTIGTVNIVAKGRNTDYCIELQKNEVDLGVNNATTETSLIKGFNIDQILRVIDTDKILSDHSLVFDIRIAVELPDTSRTFTIEAGGDIETKGYVYSQNAPLAFVAGGKVTFRRGVVTGYGPNKFPTIADILYVEADDVEFPASGHNFHSGIGPNCIFRIVTNKGIHVDALPGQTPSTFYGGNGQGTIIIQPKNPAADIYVFGTPSSHASDFFISEYFLRQAIAVSLFIGSITKTVGNTATHGYVSNAENQSNGTGNFFIGNGSSTEIILGFTNYYIQSDANTPMSILFNFAPSGWMRVLSDRYILFNTPKASIKSNRDWTETSYCDIEMSKGSGSIAFTAASVGAWANCLVLKADTLGYPARSFLDLQGSGGAYIKNLKPASSINTTTSLWSIAANNSSIALWNADTALTGLGTITNADNLYIRSGGTINLNQNNTVKAVSLECNSSTISNGWTIDFKSIIGNLAAAANNESPGGAITISATDISNPTLDAAGCITVQEMLTPWNSTVSGVISKNGAITIEPALRSAGVTQRRYIFIGDGSTPVEIRSAANASDTGALVRLRGPVLSAPGGPYSLTLASGQSTLDFAEYVGGLTQNPLGTHYFDELTIEHGKLSKTSSNDFFAAANKLTLGVSAKVNIETTNDMKKDIILRVDGLVKHLDSTVNAGSGTFQIYPMTETKTIEYGPFQIGGPPHDVWYSSAWPSISAGSFIIGSSTHAGDITLHDVVGALNPLAAQNSGTGAIIILSGYSSLDKPLVLQAGTGGVVLDGQTSGMAGTSTVDLGSARFNVSNSALKLTHLTTGTITAGGINLDSITSDSTAPTGTNDLILNSGSGALSIAGDAGASSARIGSLTLNSAAAVTLGGSVYVTNDIITNANITMSATVGPQTLDSSGGKLLLNDNHTITHTSGLNLYSLVDGFSGTQNGIAGSGAAVELTFAASGANTATALKSGGDYTTGPYSNWFVFAGLSQGFDPNGATIPNVRVELADNAKAITVQGAATQGLPNLSIKKGRLELGSSNWFVSGGSGSGFAAGSSADIEMKAGTALSVGGNVTFESGAAAALDTASTIVFTGNGTVNTAGAQKLGSIEIDSSQTLTLNSDITLTGNWTGAGLTHNNKKVTFEVEGEHALNVRGGTITFYDLECVPVNAPAVLKFDNYPAEFVVENDLVLGVSGTGPRLTITRLRNNPDPSPDRPLPLAVSPYSNAYWFLDPGNNPTVQNLDVYYSYVEDAHLISPPPSVKAAPYNAASAVLPGQSSHYSVNWIGPNTILYAWTEDWDGNGKIDHIRLQMSASCSIGVFNPTALVNGGKIRVWDKDGYKYTVKDFDYVLGYATQGATYSYMFFIELEERDAPDGGTRPSIFIEPGPDFTVLQDFAWANNVPVEIETDSALVAAGSGLPPAVIDTTPPRIAYALTVPGKNEMYLKMTEKVNNITMIPGGDFGGNTITNARRVSDDEILLTLQDSFSPASLIAATLYSITPFISITDDAPNTVPPDPLYYKTAVQPLYPQSYYWDYPASGTPPIYAPVANGRVSDPPVTFSGSGIAQPNRFVDKIGQHRASDLLVLRPTAQQNELIFWPVYAKDASGRSHNREDGGIGTAVRYDGSESLRAPGPNTSGISINIEAASNPAVPSDVKMIISKSKIDDSYRKPELEPYTDAALRVWLPETTPLDDSVNSITPKNIADADLTPILSSAFRGNYFFDIRQENINNTGKFEFIFKIGDLYAVRLHDPAGGIPNDWYRRLRVFGVNLQELLYQRGGVTILNNVIYPGVRETVLNYYLSRGGEVTIQVFTMDGTLVKQLERGYKSAGEWAASWDGKNAGGRAVARGMYFIRAVAPDIDEIRKVMVVK